MTPEPSLIGLGVQHTDHTPERIANMDHQTVIAVALVIVIWMPIFALTISLLRD